MKIAAGLLFSLTFFIRPVAAADLNTPSHESGREPFAAYHQQLDRILSEVLERSEGSRQQSSVTPEEEPGRAEPATGEHIRQFAERHWRGREQSLREALHRLEQLRPTFRGILQAEGIPEALIAVVLVESAAQPLAASPKQARGLWQFIPDTARRYGLVVERGRDDRIHPERATRAAARYLRDLYEQFGSWPLALAAYNAGENAVARALRRANGADFRTLSGRKLLPAETRNYVPAVLHAMELLGGGVLEILNSAKAKPQERVYAETSPAG